MWLVSPITVLVLCTASFIFESQCRDFSFSDKKLHRSVRSPNGTATILNRGIAKFQTKTIQLIIGTANVFSQKLFKEIADVHQGNFVLSPVGIFLIVSMLASNSRSKTEIEMRTVLNYPEYAYIAAFGFKSLALELSNYKSANLVVANKMYLNHDMSPKEELTMVANNVFGYDIGYLNMTDAKNSTSVINIWCSSSTKNLIKDIVHADEFQDSPLMYLVSAVYFNGMWVTRFDESLTKNRPFYTSVEKTSNVMSMEVEGLFRYGDLPEADATFVELPYKSDHDYSRFSMFIILPNNRDGLALMEDIFFSNISVQQLINAAEPMHVRIVLPKFTITSEIALSQSLANMGMLRAFGHAAFDGMSGYPKVGRNRVRQKAVIVVDEAGEGPPIVPRTKTTDFVTQFEATHPFLAIVADTSGSPLTLLTLRYTGPP